ncbi:hypothetical protein FXO38_07972 [Capsicum annuum]|nr:hypothetical protein FXO38_07972 [Capsicum annuum]
MHFAYASPMNAFKNIWEDSRDTVTAIDSSSIGVLLLGISPHPMIFLLCEGRIIFEDFMKMDSPQFNGDPSVNAYRFLVRRGGIAVRPSPHSGDLVIGVPWRSRDAETPTLVTNLGWGLGRRVHGRFHVARGITGCLGLIMPLHRSNEQNTYANNVLPSHGIWTRNRAHAPEFVTNPGALPIQTSPYLAHRFGVNYTQPH